ncbi:uncharacterized protein LOC144773327 [Lissotriton helveticus]
MPSKENAHPRHAAYGERIAGFLVVRKEQARRRDLSQKRVAVNYNITERKRNREAYTGVIRQFTKRLQNSNSSNYENVRAHEHQCLPLYNNRHGAAHQLSTSRQEKHRGPFLEAEHLISEMLSSTLLRFSYAFRQQP